MNKKRGRRFALKTFIVGWVFLASPHALFAYIVASNPSSGTWGTDRAYGVALDSSSVYVVGFDSAPGNHEWRIEKRDKTTGALVPAFGTSGVIVSNPGVLNDYLRSISVDSTDIYCTGQAGEWRIEKRNKTTGALVPAFGTNGVVTNNPSGFDSAYALAVDSSSLYVAGFDNLPGNREWRIEKRDKTTGALVPSFGTNGVVTSNPSAFDEFPNFIAADSADIYIAGYDSAPGNPEWRIEKRDKATGSLVPAFGTNGVVTSNPSGSFNTALMVAIDSSSVYVVAKDDSPGIDGRIEKRDKITGALVTAFGTNGVVAVINAISYGSVAIDSNSVYLAGSDILSGPRKWHMEKRDKATGALVSAFGTNGVVSNNPSAYDDEAQSVAIDSGSMYVVGWDGLPANSEWRMEKRDILNGLSIPLSASSLIFQGVNYSSITLRFLDNSNEETGFQIYRSSDGVNFNVLVATVGAVASSGGLAGFMDTQLISGATYWYSVRTFVSSGPAITYSDAILGSTVTLLGNFPPPSPPPPSITDLSNVWAGPNPYRPLRNPGQSLTFRNLPSDGKVKIYNYVGELLRELSAGSSGIVSWDGKNSSGRMAASGVYLALVQGGGDKKIFKIILEK